MKEITGQYINLSGILRISESKKVKNTTMVLSSRGKSQKLLELKDGCVLICWREAISDKKRVLNKETNV